MKTAKVMPFTKLGIEINLQITGCFMTVKIFKIEKLGLNNFIEKDNLLSNMDSESTDQLNQH